MKILWKGGYDSEVEDFMRFEPRRKLLSDSDSKFSLFAIMTKPAGRQRVSLVEGDVHSCGAANIGGAGSRQGERDGEKQASCPSSVSSDSSQKTLCLPREGNPNQLSLFPGRSEVRASQDYEADANNRPPNIFLYCQHLWLWGEETLLIHSISRWVQIKSNTAWWRFHNFWPTCMKVKCKKKKVVWRVVGSLAAFQVIPLCFVRFPLWTWDSKLVLSALIAANLR